MKISCEDCGSSDGCELYDDGHTHCFVCETTKFPKEERIEDANINNARHTASSGSTVDAIRSYRSYPIHSRGISKEVVDYFNVKMSTTPSGAPASHFYPKTKKGNIVGYKERILPKVGFPQHGDVTGTELFGQAQCAGNRTLVITEGEIDAMSVAEAWYRKNGRIFDVVSLDNAPGIKGLIHNMKFINRYDEVVLMIDGDEKGQDSIPGIGKVVSAGKLKIATLPLKDANEVLIHPDYGPDVITRSIWNAETWTPAAIVMGEAVWAQYKEQQKVEALPYPECLSGLNDKLKGMRLGEIALFISGTGSGKSTAIKEIIFELLTKEEIKVGLISLEEGIGESAENLIEMQLQKPIEDASPEEERAGFEALFSDERLILLDHQGSVSDDSLLANIEYLCLMGCQYIILDHITIAVSEGDNGKTGNEAIDAMMSDLLKIVKKHKVWLGLISHLRKAPSGGLSFEEGKFASMDDIKGSGSIKQICFDIIAMARDTTAEDEDERNTARIRVLKARKTGKTGDCGAIKYNPNTRRLQDARVLDLEAFGL